MIAFQNKKNFSLDKLNQKDKTVSTLLVPAHLVSFLKKKTKENGNSLTVYLRNLLSIYRLVTHSGMIPSPRKIKTEYQDEGLDLERINFRVGNADWLELGELALAFGKSRCWMFTFLLELDLTGLRDILSKFELTDAVPTKKNLELKVSWALERGSQYFKRSYRVRV
jgi:hypothetical protein